MDSFYSGLAEHLQKGERLGLAVIIRQQGSAPRGAGACMARFADGTLAGTVGGGEAEHRCGQLLQQVVDENRAFVEHFHLGAQQAASIGMVCGGDVSVLFVPVDGQAAGAPALFEALAQAQTAPEQRWLLLSLQHGAAGAALLGAGNTLSTGSIAIPDADTQKDLCQEAPVLLEQDGTLLFSLPAGAQGAVYVFGGGHVAQKLVPQLAFLGFGCHVYDDRAEFANKALFPDALTTTVCSFEDVFNILPISARDYIVIMTRGHLSDYTLLAQALPTPARYIGMIGSRRKISATYTRLIQEEGFPYAAMARVHAPIGLDIKAQTPAEIAVSIAAEMIAERAKPLSGL